MRSSEAKAVAAEIHGILQHDGSAEHAKGAQRFFKEEIESYGWYAADLRSLAKTHRRKVVDENGIDFLVRVADQLFRGRVLEPKIVAVLLLENLTHKLDNSHFALFESWLDRVSSWVDHDALVHYLIAPMVSADRARLKRVFRWAKSPDRWHRRAACVALIQGHQQQEYFRYVVRLSNMLLRDPDDMVQKGLGWLLRVTAKVDPAETVPYLLNIRSRTPRLVLRTACETLSLSQKRRVLVKQVK